MRRHQNKEKDPANSARAELYHTFNNLDSCFILVVGQPTEMEALLFRESRNQAIKWKGKGPGHPAVACS